MMLFTEIAKALQVQLQTNMPQIRVVLKKNPAMAYTLITKLGGEVGEKYGVKIIVNFPGRERINEFDMYGRRDISIIMDQSKTRFPIERELVKSTALEKIPRARTQDAYMYEGRVRIFVKYHDRVFNATAPYDFDDDANARFGCI